MNLFDKQQRHVIQILQKHRLILLSYHYDNGIFICYFRYKNYFIEADYYKSIYGIEKKWDIEYYINNRIEGDNNINYLDVLYKIKRRLKIRNG